MSQRKTTAIVMAAGKGSRMQAGKNKVYLELQGKPVLYYSLKALQNSEMDEVILVVSPGDEDSVRRDIVDFYGFDKVTKIVPGGRERFESVSFGIDACEQAGEEHYIFIHDGARPFISPEQFNHCIREVELYKACVLAMPVKDTIRIIGEDGYPRLTPDRKDVWQMQTPQCFLLSEAKEAFRKMMTSEAGNITDDVMVLERFGGRRSKMIEGSYDNIKLTTPEDMIVGENILKRRNAMHESSE